MPTVLWVMPFHGTLLVSEPLRTSLVRSIEQSMVSKRDKKEKYKPETDQRAEQSGKCLSKANIDPTTESHATDPTIAEKVWMLSEKLVGQEFRYD
jgi:hypothetical protein